MITALNQADESAISLDHEETESISDKDSDEEERRQREKHLKKRKKGIAGAKTMEPPVTALCHCF
jgi:hypothetical protein